MLAVDAGRGVCAGRMRSIVGSQVAVHNRCTGACLLVASMMGKHSSKNCVFPDMRKPSMIHPDSPLADGFGHDGVNLRLLRLRQRSISRSGARCPC